MAGGNPPHPRTHRPPMVFLDTPQADARTQTTKYTTCRNAEHAFFSLTLPAAVGQACTCCGNTSNPTNFYFINQLFPFQNASLNITYYLMNVIIMLHTVNKITTHFHKQTNTNILSPISPLICFSSWCNERN